VCGGWTDRPCWTPRSRYSTAWCTTTWARSGMTAAAQRVTTATRCRRRQTLQRRTPSWRHRLPATTPRRRYLFLATPNVNSCLLITYCNCNDDTWTMFTALSHCESSPGWFDECRTAPTLRPSLWVCLKLLESIHTIAIQNLPFQQILSSLDFLYLLDWLMITGLDRIYHAHRFISSFTF